jgi:hypothetical protein
LSFEVQIKTSAQPVIAIVLGHQEKLTHSYQDKLTRRMRSSYNMPVWKTAGMGFA